MKYIEIDNTPIMADIKDILVKLRQELGYFRRIKDTNNNYMVVCPFHDDTDPSLGITRRKVKKLDGHTVPAGTVNCFGCDYSADFLTFIANLKNITPKKAKKWLLNNFEKGQYLKRAIDMEQEQEPKTYDLSHFENYHPYMAKRGIQKDYIKRYNLKYNPESNTIVFPIYKKGKIIGYEERGVEHKWIHDEGTTNTLYGRQCLYPSNEIWLTEGPIDCIITVQSGFNAVAILGGISNQKIKEIKQLPNRVLVCAFDDDKTGDYYTDLIYNNISDKIIKKATFRANDPGAMTDSFDYNINILTGGNYAANI